MSQSEQRLPVPVIIANGQPKQPKSTQGNKYVFCVASRYDSEKYPLDLFTMAESYLKGMYEKLGASYLCGSLEKCPTTGKPHIQFVFHLPKPGMRETAMWKIDPGCDFSPGNCDNYYNLHGYEYSAKPETHLEGPWRFGIRPAQRNKKGDTARKNQELIALGTRAAIDQGLIPIMKGPDLSRALMHYHSLAPVARRATCDNEWHWGVTNAGKSHSAWERYPNLYKKKANKWWDGYIQQEAVLIDEMTPGKIDSDDMKEITDVYPFQAEYKFGQMLIRPKVIIICSNYSIRDCYPDPRDYEPIERRFKVHHYTKPFEPPKPHDTGKVWINGVAGNAVSFGDSGSGQLPQTPQEEESKE